MKRNRILLKYASIPLVSPLVIIRFADHLVKKTHRESDNQIELDLLNDSAFPTISPDLNGIVYGFVSCIYTEISP